MGEVGRFRPTRPLACRRGDRAVVQSFRGVELGEVLCPATPGHARYFVNTSVGKLLRLAEEADERAAARLQDQAWKLFDDGRSLAAGLDLPLEVFDAEVLLDGEHAVLHHLRWGAFDERPFVSTLSRRHGLHIALHYPPTPAGDHDEEHGCGSCGSGGCGSCGSGGCGSCHVPAAAPSAAGTADDGPQAHFAALRERMVAQGRTPLL
jgi:hypothetical protein